VLAVLDLDGPDKRPINASRYHRELMKGANERALELGFKAEPFIIGRKGISAPRLDTILQSRGIRGVFVLPVDDNPDISKLDWGRYAGIYADYIIERPALHSVCADHYRSMITALHRLHGLGYSRPGLVLQRHHDERLLFRWEAAFRAYEDHTDEFARIDPLITSEITRAEFCSWFTSQKPDVVLCHRAEVVAWMQECGARVPETHGFCCLNVMMNEIPCAGIDLQPRLIGARGVELIIAQLYRNEYGVPDIPSTTTIPAAWVDGPTLRELSASAAG
jgi:LacI family transcriptional regulator